MCDSLWSIWMTNTTNQDKHCSYQTCNICIITGPLEHNWWKPLLKLVNKLDYRKTYLRNFQTDRIRMAVMLLYAFFLKHELTSFLKRGNLLSWDLVMLSSKFSLLSVATISKVISILPVLTMYTPLSDFWVSFSLPHLYCNIAFSSSPLPLALAPGLLDY